MSVTGLDRVTVVHPDGTVALHEVSLLAAAGELTVVLGASGSGKSTLLRTLAGFTSVRSGSVVLDDLDVTRLPTHERNLAMVFEHDSLVPTLDVAENIGFALTLHHVGADEVRVRVSEQARGLRLTNLLSRKPRTLSTGERSQVSIGRALARVPAAFLFDEPLAHLDAAERGRMRRHLAKVIKTAGVTTLYVTHDQSDALAIGDRVAVLRAGRVVQIATPHDLYARPVDLYVAGFVDTVPIGLLPAHVVVAGGQAGFRVGARTLPLWSPAAPQLHDGQPVVLGLRLRDVNPSGRDDDPRLVSMPGIVARMEHTGADAVVGVTVAARPVRTPGAVGTDANAQLWSRFPRDTAVRPGDAVELTVDVSRAHVFDADTGAALLHPED